VTTVKSTQGATAIPIVHDTLAYGLPSTVHTLNSRHPLEARIKNWDAHHEQLKLELAKRLGGIGEAIRIGTEKFLVSQVSSEMIVLMIGLSTRCVGWTVKCTCGYYCWERHEH
jgi:proteasome maturation protein